MALAVIGAIAFLLLRRRGRPPESLQAAYVATATMRGRLAQQVSAPTTAPGELEQQVDEADRALRTAQVSDLSNAARSSVEQALAAVAQIREALALRGPEAEIRTALGRALASLDSALGSLQAAARGEAPPPSSDSMGFTD